VDASRRSRGGWESGEQRRRAERHTFLGRSVAERSSLSTGTWSGAAAQLTSLQRSIGNQRVAKALIQRGEDGPGPTGKPKGTGYHGPGTSMVDGQPLVEGQWAISLVQQASSLAGHTWVILEGLAREKPEGAWQWACDFVAPQLPGPERPRFPTMSELVLANSWFGPEMIGTVRVFEDRDARDKWYGMTVLAKRTFRVPEAAGRAAQQKIQADRQRRIPYRMTGAGYMPSTPGDAESCASWTASIGEAAGITGLAGWVVDTPAGVAGSWG